MYLYGAGGHSKVITDILKSLGVEVLGVFDDQPLGAKLKTMGIDSGIRVQGEAFPKLDAPLIAIVQSAAKVGRHVLVNTAASIDHDNEIGDYAHVSPHATLCGHVKVGEGTHIGAGAVVIPSIRIGKWCTIGAGTVVIRDIPDYATAVGNPARVIKMREAPFLRDEG